MVLYEAVKVGPLCLLGLRQADPIVRVEVFHKQAVLLPGSEAQQRVTMLTGYLSIVYTSLSTAKQVRHEQLSSDVAITRLVSDHPDLPWYWSPLPSCCS